MNYRLKIERTGRKTAALVVALFLVLAIAVPASTARAEQSPDAVLKEIIDKIKSTGNPSPVVEYVDWQEAFAKAPADQKQAMNLTGPEEMKNFYRDVLTKPSELLKKQFEQRLGSVPPEQQEMMRASVERMEKMMEQKEVEMRKRIVGTSYEIGAAKIDGDKAVVPLKQTYEGTTKDESVEFVKSGDRWLLPSVGMMGGEPNRQGPPPAPPAGATPGAMPPALAPQ